MSVRLAYQTVPSLKILSFLIPSINLVHHGEGDVDAEDYVGAEDPGVVAERDTPEPPGTRVSMGIQEDVPEAHGTEAIIVVSWALMGVEAPNALVAALMGGS
jgi:hypothetical protein